MWSKMMRLSSLSIVAACASTLLSVHANADRGGLADRGMQSIRRGEQSNAPVSTVPSDRKATKEGHWGGSLAGSEASQILFYRDYAIGACAYEAALQGGALGTVTFTSSATTFAGLIANGTEWDLIVVANQNTSNLGTFQQALVTYHAADAGCGIIVSDWKDTSAASYFPALGFSHNQPWNVFGALSIEPGSTVSGSSPVTLVDIGWDVWNTGTIGGGTAELRGTQSNVMSARNGKVIVNGFLSDTLSPFANGVDMVRRQMAALTRPPCNFGDCNNDGICDDGQLPGNDCNGNNVLDSCDIANGSATDCNGNGTPDSCEIAGGAADCNGNGTLDSCELASGAAADCNGNGTLDSCDIAAGTPDCNGNGKPDSCDIQRGSATDCNGNGVPDSCDIIGGSANDVNQNGIPDSCEPDCNGNGIPDAYEVAGGFVADCDNNGQPDSCDIAGGAADCDTDGVLDSCELAAGAPDCNGNGIQDSCDLASGAALDCNGNSVPDSCDLANGAPDCNGNGIQDSCDIASGAALDCNGNSVPDSCDLANGAPDCNGNGIQDSCDLASGAALDCNGNSVPDSCDLANGSAKDCNGNSIPDSCDIASGFSTDPEGDGIPNSCEPDPGVTMAGPGNAAPGQCSAIGDEVVFNVSVLNPPIVTVAGQFNVVYDRAVLEYVGISGGDAPITDILVSNHDAGNGSIFWISTIPNGGSGTLADLRVASLRFRVIADDCDGGVHASLDEGFAPVLIANDGGITADLPLTQPASFVIDTTGPVLSGVPADLTVPADAGSGCFAARELTPPSVIDNCGDADLVITRSDAQPLGAPWACGTTIVTWSATDGCGRTAQATTSVTVEPYHLLDLRLAYAGSGYASSMGRCIDIDLGDVEAAVAMTFAAGVGMETIQVPVGSYGCATADDDLHSLVSTGSVVIEGTRYVLALAGTSALVNGDVTDDNLVNVADWGVIVTRIGSMQPADVDCSTAGFHVDFNGDGAVTQADGDFIVASLLRTGATGCGALIGGSADEGSMSVDQLAAIAGPDAILADLNGDGMVDLDDVSLWAAARERRGEE
jgi:hypothetical protein